MRSVMKLAVALALSAAGFIASASPASADHGPRHNYGGDGSDAGYEAWGWVAAATGGNGGADGSVPGCTNFFQPDQPAHYEWHRYADEPLTLYVDCVTNGHSLPYDRRPTNLGDGTWSVLQIVNPVPPPGDFEALLDAVLNQLNPTAPAIGSNPGAGMTTLVGFETWFWLEGNVGPQSQTIGDGIVSVELTATPIGQVEWATGDGGRFSCAFDQMPTYNLSAPAASQHSSCTHRFTATGEAMSVEATITYTGSYAVYVGGIYVGGGALNVPVPRFSQDTVRVAEGQAIVTGG